MLGKIDPLRKYMVEKRHNLETIILGGGCFWCLDAAYRHINGVADVFCGYAGGNFEQPTYEKVSSGKTGHAEVVKVVFDTEIISLNDILNIFFAMHDPTTLNRQGSDIGSQYRSIILYNNENQKITAQDLIQELFNKKVYENQIVTEIKPLKKFYIAEDYHQRYFEKNPDAAYCQIIISPKIAKLRKEFRRFWQ